MSRFRLYAFDLDGTLLSRDGTLPPAVLDFIRGLAGRARVTLATGRSLASARPFAEALGINAPAILYHGAVIWDFSTGKALWEKRLPPDEARRAISACRGFPVDVQLYRAAGDPTVYVERITPPVRKFSQKEHLPLKETDLISLGEEGPLKLLIIGRPEVLPELAAALRAAAPGLTVVRAERNYLEVLPPGVDKGAALERLCRHLGVPLSQAVAVGDQESDLPMLERAGLGVAMVTAPGPVREKADLVVGSVPELARHIAG